MPQNYVPSNTYNLTSHNFTSKFTTQMPNSNFDLV